MPQINIDNFKDPILKAEYQRKLIEKQKKEIEVEYKPDNTTKWNEIVEKCLTTGVEVLGRKEKQNKKTDNVEIKNLSEVNKRLRDEIKVCRWNKTRIKLKEESMKNKKKIDRRLKEIEETEIDSKMEKLEKIKDDNTNILCTQRYAE